MASTSRLHLNFLWVLSFVTPILLVSGEARVDCPSGEFACLNGECINQASLCDGTKDCTDGLDESRDYCVMNDVCINGLFTCTQSRGGTPPFCLKNSSVCDGVPDCTSGEDELSSACSDSSYCGQDTFRCTDKFCILNVQVCDGISDCVSGSDEVNCPVRACPTPSFNCTYGLCIPADQACDGVWHCRDGSDENPAYCHPNVTCMSTEFYCSSNKPAESCVKVDDFCRGTTACASSLFNRTDCGVQICERDHPCGSGGQCRNLALGFECFCSMGFKLSADKISCQDLNECIETPWVCDQYCSNTAGSYRCSCAAGYSETSTPGKCEREDRSINPVIYFGHENFISQIGLDGSNYQQFALNRTFAHVLDFDWMTQRVYHFDFKEQSLHAMNTDGSHDELLDQLHSTSVEGIAIDWIHRKILWTSAQLKGIYVAEMNGSFISPLVSGVSSNCRGIAVHPQSRFIFWTDWSSSPFIARIGLDGSLMSKMITTGLFWPNGITVDYVVDKIWWVDALLDIIEYADLDGSNRHVAAFKSISHPYSIVVFESLVFWSDWNYKSINVTNRYTGEYMPPLISNLPIQPFDVKVFHPVRQPPVTGTNPCKKNNGGCSHLCLPSPLNQTSYKCACPQGSPLLSDGKTCSVNCSASEMRCDDGVCIPWYYKCNGRKDCKTGEDEPSTCPQRTCAWNQFECNFAENVKVCLSLTNLCDGVAHCADGSDEDSVRCGSRVCLPWEFLCTSTGRCIPDTWLCDMQPDCSMGEDEAPINSKCNISVPCKDDEFRCNNSRCIPQSYFCDMDDDCHDRSDEPSDCWIYRNNNPCPAGYQRCPKNYRCIAVSAFCNGLNDCYDGSDELPEYCMQCKEGEYTCSNKHCIPLRWRCDFSNDCGDGSDENVTMCSGLYRNCTSAEFRCNNNRCLNSRIKCDGNNDCGDGSDEIDCGGCPSGLFQCQNSQCIQEQQRCDGFADCTDLSDEYGCPTRFPGGKYCIDEQFTCDNTICIEKIRVCDGIEHCGDGSDETPAACQSVQCPNDMFQCPRVRYCIPPNQVCDGIANCEYGGDEVNCSNCSQAGLQLFTCESDGSCIPEELRCDLKYDCQDGSDERDCLLADCRECQQNCTVTSPSTYQTVCSCWNGYTINPLDIRTCIEVNSCQTLASNWCPHTCVNMKRNSNETYKCLCAEGFEDVFNDGRICQPRDGYRGGLIYGLGHRILIQNFTNNEAIQVNDVPHSSGGDIAALDVDARKLVAYWVDATTLFRAAIPKDSMDLAYVQRIRNITHATGLAYDWITGNIYWSDVNGIYVTSEKVYWLTTTLIQNNDANFRPARLIVNPRIGRLFFINDNEHNPSVMSLGMNGENMTAIVQSNLFYPSDLAIDLDSSNRLFWTDGGANVIESCLPDGTDRTLHVTDGQHPFRLDIFAGTLYWTTTGRDHISMAQGMGHGAQTEFLTNQTGAGPVKYVHDLKYNYYKTNKCETRGCTFCLLGPGEAKCVCPDGSQFKDVLTCNLQVPPGYIPLEEPKVCSCQNDGYCELVSGLPKCICLPGFTGDQCESTTGAYSQPSPSTRTPSPSGTAPASATISSTSSPSTASTQSIPWEAPVASSNTSNRKRDISIALPIVFGILLIAIIAVGLLWVYRNGKLKRRTSTYGRHIDDTSSVSSFPASPSSPREPVAFQGDAVQFGNDNHQYSNPMYREMALTLDPPPYVPANGNSLEKRNLNVSEGYDQKSKPLSTSDQFNSVEFTSYPSDQPLGVDSSA